VITSTITLVLWTTSTAIAFLGAWFVKFTSDHPQNKGRVVLTKPGKITLPIASLAFLVGLGLQINDQKHARASDKENRALHQEVSEIREGVHQMTTQFAAAVATTPVTRAIVSNSEASNQVTYAFDAAVRIDPSLQDIREQTHRLMTGNLLKTPLEAAVDASDQSKAEVILNSGADPNVSGDLGIPPLGLAASKNDIRSATLLLNAGANINEPSRFDHKTPLFYARTVEMAALLLQHHANMEAVDDQGETPLSIASVVPNYDLIKLYIQRKANTNVANMRGESPLKRAAQNGAAKDVELLLEGGADPNFAPPPDHVTALNYFMLQNPCPAMDRLENLSRLVQHGARCDLRDKWGSPLERAMSNHCEPFAKILRACIHNAHE
jgi:ankyrin repeat protein